MLCGYRKPENIAVFISGGGSTLQALLEMQHQFNVALVISNKKSAEGLKKAKRFGKPVFVMNKDTSFDSIEELLTQYNISGIFLAGFMKILPEEFVNRWKNKILNIHPSLLPHYKGLHS
ncbi:MAG: formyltransferase family protein, partial [Pseudobdellovibrio sp.]